MSREIRNEKKARLNHAVMFHEGGTKFYEITVVSSFENRDSIIIFRYGSVSSYPSGGQIDVKFCNNGSDSHSNALLIAQKKAREKIKRGYTVSPPLSEGTGIRALYGRHSESSSDFDENDAGWKLGTGGMTGFQQDECAATVPVTLLVDAAVITLGGGVARQIQETVQGADDYDREPVDKLSLTSVPITAGDDDDAW